MVSASRARTRCTPRVGGDDVKRGWKGMNNPTAAPTSVRRGREREGGGAPSVSQRFERGGAGAHARGWLRRCAAVLASRGRLPAEMHLTGCQALRKQRKQAKRVPLQASTAERTASRGPGATGRAAAKASRKRKRAQSRAQANRLWVRGGRILLSKGGSRASGVGEKRSG
jgi:hypothetical protein